MKKEAEEKLERERLEREKDLAKIHVDHHIVNELNNKVPDPAKRKKFVRPDFESNNEHRQSEQ